MSERMWLAEQLEEARTQRDVLRVRVKELEEVIQTQNGVVVSGTLKLNEARGRVAKLEAALEPFAAEANSWDDVDMPESTCPLIACDVDDGGDYAHFTIGDLRAARAVLKDAPQ